MQLLYVKKYLLIIICFGLLLYLLSCKNDIGVKVMRFDDIYLKYKIFSTPVIMHNISITDKWAIIFVSGEINMDNKNVTAIDSYFYNGKRVPGFPVLKNYNFVVAPSNQIGINYSTNEETSELIIVGLDGKIYSSSFGNIHLKSSMYGNPLHGLLVSQPLVINDDNNNQNGILLLSRNATPVYESLNAIDFIDASGQSFPGYPIILDESPVIHPPLYDKQTGYFYVILESGKVEGFQLSKGISLQNFPTEPLITDSNDISTYRMMIMVSWKSLVISLGTNYLIKINIETGKMSTIHVSNAKQLAGIDTIDDNLLVIDEALGHLLLINENGYVINNFELKLSDYSNRYLQVIPSKDESKYFIVVISHKKNDSDKIIRKLFKKNATDHEYNDLFETAKILMQEEYKTKSLNLNQRKEMDHTIVMMQKSFLQNKLGIGKLSKLISEDIAFLTRIQVIESDFRSMEIILDDTIKGYSSETGTSLSNEIQPVVYKQKFSNDFFLVVPLNCTLLSDDLQEKNNSLIRIYKIK